MPPGPAGGLGRLVEQLPRRVSRRAGWMLLAGLAAYALAGFLLLPAWLQRALPEAIDARLGTRSALADLSINPFSLTIEASGLSLATAAEAPLLRVERLFADLSVTGIFRAALVLPELRVSGVELDLARAADGRLQAQSLLDALASPGAAAADAPLPRLLVGQFLLEVSAIRIEDLAGPRPARISLGPLRLEGEAISTLPDRTGTLRLEATLPGEGRLSAQSALALEPLAASGSVSLTGLRPALGWDFLHDRIGLAPPGGEFGVSFDWSLDPARAAAGLVLRGLAADLRGLELRRPGAPAPLLALRSASLSGAELDLAARRVSVGEIALAEGSFSAALDRAGVLDWEVLLAQDAPSPPAAAVPAAPPWQFSVGRFGIDGIALDLRDATRHAPLLATGRLSRLRLAAEGRVGGTGPELAVSGALLELEDILGRSEGREEPLATLARLRLEDANLALAPRRLQARRLEIEGLGGTLTREADGSLREIRLVSTFDPGDPLPISHAAATWSLALGELAAKGLGLRFVDVSTTPPVVYAVADGSLALRDLDTATPGTVAVEATLPIAQGGELRLAGSAAGDASRAALTLGIAGVALGPLAPLVARDTTLTLAGGTLSADLALDWQEDPGAAPAFTARGSLGIDDLLLNEAASGERLLAWRAARASGIDFALLPGRLAVRELRLVDPGARIIVQADRRTNLAQLLRVDAPVAAPPDASPGSLPDTARAVAAAEPPTVPPEPVAEAAAAAEPFPVSIERLRVDGGTVDFADLSLVLPFAVRIEQLKGVARGISSAQSARATLKFDGRVGEHGEAEIDGQLAPFDPRHATDIEIAFRNIAVNALSPYSATFAGRAIESGDLDLGLQYKVDGGRLAGDNQLLLRDLRLGAKVKSPDATSLPLDLAIALLTDSRGRIDIALPVSGNVDDPRFSYGRIIWKAIGNLIAGVATAPFRALGGLFGGGAGAEQMQAVHFPSGSAELRPRELKQLATLADALASRPRLGVGVAPGVESARDGNALRRLAVRRAHAGELGIELDPGEDPGPVSYADGHSQRALEKLLEDREGEEANARFAAQWTKKSGREPERVNPALAFFGGDSEDTEYYRALYLHLVRSTPEPSEALAALGQARAEAILAELTRRGVEPARLESGKPAPLRKAQPSGVLLPLSLVPRGGR